MRKNGAGPSWAERVRRIFQNGKNSLLRGLNGLAERLALWLFYPLAAYPAGRALAQQNLAANRTQDVCGRPVLRQEAAEVCGLRFGKSDLGRAGCGAVSVYNALVLLGRGGTQGQPAGPPKTPGAAAAIRAGKTTAAGASVTLAGVIHTFERSRGLVLGGRAGATPWALRRVLRQYGVAARRMRSLAALEKAMLPGGVAILMIWNDRAQIRRGAHFFAVQRNFYEKGDGQGFAGYNCWPQHSPALAGLVGGGRFAAGFLLYDPETP